MQKYDGVGALFCADGSPLHGSQGTVQSPAHLSQAGAPEAVHYQAVGLVGTGIGADTTAGIEEAPLKVGAAVLGVAAKIVGRSCADIVAKGEDAA